MNWQLFSLILTATIALIKCDKLNGEENEFRLATCGQKMTQKIYDGEQRSHRESPWTVFVKSSSPKLSGTCTGTIISPRHILTATHCVAPPNPQMTYFLEILMNGKKIEKADCVGDDYIIDDPNVAEKVTFGIGDSIDETHSFPYKAKKLWLLSACRKFETSTSLVDITLIELQNDFTFGRDLHMACVSDSMSDVAAGITVDFYGYGTNPAKTTNYHRREWMRDLLYEESIIIKPRFVFRSPRPKSGETSIEEHILLRSVGEQTVACAGDSGGGMTRKIKGRTTVVGVASQTSCSNLHRTTTGQEWFYPVASRSHAICEYAGICSTSSRTNVFLIGLIISASYFAYNE